MPKKKVVTKKEKKVVETPVIEAVKAMPDVKAVIEKHLDKPWVHDEKERILKDLGL